MGIFDEFVAGRQQAQQQALNQLKMQQAQSLGPLEEQLKQLQIQGEQQGLAAGQQTQDKADTEAKREQTLLAGRLAEQALSLEDQDMRNIFIQGAAQKLGIQDEFDPSQVDDETLMQLIAAKQSLEPGKGGKLGRVFKAKDAQGNAVFAQADEAGNTSVIEGLTPLDLEQQNIDLQREIAEGKAEVSSKKLDAIKKKAESEKKADVNSLTNTLSQIDSLINDPSFSGSVGVVDQFTARVGALFGTEDGVVNRRATRLLNSSVAKIAKSLGANPTDKDIELLKSTQPSMSDQPSVWEDWYLNDVIPTINARLVALGQPEIVPMTAEDSQGNSAVKRLKYNPGTGQFE
jgi:hypothetical protein